MGACELGGTADAVVVGGRVAEADVVGDGPPEQRRMLRHESRLPPPRSLVKIREIPTAHEDPPGRGLREAEKERDERALPHSARPHDRDGLAG